MLSNEYRFGILKFSPSYVILECMKKKDVIIRFKIIRGVSIYILIIGGVSAGKKSGN